MNILDMKETGAKSTREYRTIKPVYIRKLSNKMVTQEEVGNAIGVGGATICNYLKNDQATMAMEMAAQFVYERDFPEGGGKPKLVTSIISGELHHAKTIKDMIEMLGGKFNFLEM
jgi:hypothetical protein